MLTEKDLKQIEAHGLTLDDVIAQLEKFQQGTPFVNVVTHASIDNGIEAVTETQKQKYISFYDARKKDMEIVKFVPASGAATRMFKFLIQFLEEFDPEEERLAMFIKNGGYFDLKKFIDNLKYFPFVNDVRRIIREQFPDFKNNKKGVRTRIFIETLLSQNGLNYKNLPKGLIPFHKYKKYYTTAFEEQLFEAAFYATAVNNTYLHFTFSEEHVNLFKSEFERIKTRVEKKTKVEYHISYSFQDKKTDTIAVTPLNRPYHNANGDLVFRPSGHGALLQNLNDINADIIFIKNIDNVVCEQYVEELVGYKKMLAGKLLSLQEKIYKYSEMCEGDNLSKEELSQIQSFLFKELNIKNAPNDCIHFSYLLNRPLRVCGVVRNTGAPGGGPFWVKDDYENVTLQIVEAVQIDTSDEHQANCLKEATHFNPVDIVCSIKDRNGKKYDLQKFCDVNAGFISEKSENGNPIKALELPGLWNGAMAKWNTALVEVPLSTFNPVKTVNDLLQIEHRPNA